MMAPEPLLAAAAVLVLGIAAQAVAWRLRMPSILVLLVVGALAGPVTGLLDPDALMGGLLTPLVSLGVAILLFEGGLNLDLQEVRAHGGIVTRLVTLGVVVTWVVGGVAAFFLLDIGTGGAAILGAILVVSGPTVIGPLLRHVRPGKDAETVLKWEGILIDPIGALLAVLVFEAVLQGVGSESLVEAGLALLATLVFEAVLQGVGSESLVEARLALLTTVAVGLGVGLAAAFVLVFLERRYWVPDFLTVAVALALVVAAFTVADVLQSEAGLFAVTIMGVALANQRRVSVHHIIDFKEDLSQILIGSLFILLAARVRPDDLARLDWRVFVFIAALVLVARPLTVALSTWGSDLGRKERVLLAWLAPRGIVAAAVASLFALRLEATGDPAGALLVPITFTTIVTTVALYGLTAAPLAKALGISRPDPQGVLFVGANPVSRRLAAVLDEEGYRTVLVDTDVQALTAARTEGLEAMHGNILSVHLSESLDLTGIGRLWAMTPNEETNSLAAVHYADDFGRAKVYQVCTDDEGGARHAHLRGRTLFRNDLTYRTLRDRFASGEWTLRRTPITERFRHDDWQEQHPDGVPLFLIGEDRRIEVFTTDHVPDVLPGKTLVALVRAGPAQARVEEA